MVDSWLYLFISQAEVVLLAGELFERPHMTEHLVAVQLRCVLDDSLPTSINSVLEISQRVAPM